MIVFKLLVSFWLFVHPLQISCSYKFKITRLEGSCNEYPNATMRFDDIQLNIYHRSQYISAKLVVQKTTGTFLRMEASCLRCVSKESLDSCEPSVVRFKNVCTMFTANLQMWSPLADSFSPKLYCPIAKGAYRAANGSMDAGPMLAVLGRWFWKCTVTMADVRDDRSPIAFCFKLDGQSTKM